MSSFLEQLYSLAGKTALVLGASRGIGFSLAEGLQLAGAEVYGLSRSSSSVQKCNFNYVRCDVTNDFELRSVIEGINEKSKSIAKSIDILVNAAGITVPDTDEDIDMRLESFEKTLDVNLRAPFHAISLVSEFMKESGGGSIINVTSIAAEAGFPGNPSYVASKGALKLLTKAFAEDLAIHNIRVNNLSPGYILTDMTRNSYKDEHLRSLRTRNMMLKRWGTTEDLVGAVIYLAGDGSSYVTGSDLMVDGGWSAKGFV